MITKDTITPYLASLQKEIDAVIEKTFNEWCDEVVQVLRNRVPVDTGTLRSTIRTYRNGDIWVIEVGNEQVNYGPFLEYGTRFQKAQPFFNTTLNEMEPRLINKLNSALDKIK